MAMRDARLLSRPIGVEWAGWRTDTFRLQQAGWQLAVELESYDMRYRLLMRHEMMKLHAVTGLTHIDFESITRMDSRSLADVPVFHVTHVAPRMESISVPGVDWSKFQAIDAQPCYTEKRIERIEDFNIFNVTLTRAEEILVDQADMTVLEHLEAIRNLQSEEQKRLREQARRQDSYSSCSTEPQPQVNVMANVVTIAA